MGWLGAGAVTLVLSLAGYKFIYPSSSPIPSTPLQGDLSLKSSEGDAQNKDQDELDAARTKDANGEASESPRETEASSESSVSQSTASEEDDGSLTPKAKAQATDGSPVPSFSLAEPEPKNHDHTTSAPLSGQGQPVKAVESKPKVQNASKPTASSLMPPPPRPSPASQLRSPPTTTSGSRVPAKSPSTLRPPPSAASSLRVPVTKPSNVYTTNRPAASSLTTSTLPAPSRPSRKVILTPGHSPLDWAALSQNPSSNLRGANLPPNLIRVTPSMLKKQNGRKGKDAWSAYRGKVYNITPYLPFHPGGENELMKGAGRDGTTSFVDVHPWVNWEGMLGECMIGILVGENEESGKMEEMD